MPLIDNFIVEESEDQYIRLLAAARATAMKLIKTPADSLGGAASYIYHVSQELAAMSNPTPHEAIETELAIFECLNRLLDAWPHLCSGLIRGEQVLANEPILWKKAMTEWPMGDYARMAASFMIDHGLLGGAVLELGAGIGSCSALVAGHVGDGFIRTDLQPALLKRQNIPGLVEAYDFNHPGPWRDLDTIFSVNALHCAKNKLASLAYLRCMLKPGGVLVLGEGSPYTDSRGSPWALNGFFGLFQGWWDVGGFLSRDEWVRLLEQAGFSEIGWGARHAGAHDLGGLIWAIH